MKPLSGPALARQLSPHFPIGKATRKLSGEFAGCHVIDFYHPGWDKPVLPAAEYAAQLHHHLGENFEVVQTCQELNTWATSPFPMCSTVIIRFVERVTIPIPRLLMLPANVSVKLELQPVSFKEASAFIVKHHRHHIPSRGWKFGIAVNDGSRVCGVVMVGRPVARRLDDTWTLEVTRCCTDGTKNAASMLYAAAWRATKAMGYKRLITYTMETESGGSLRACGWKQLYSTNGKSWNVPSRSRVDKHEVNVQRTLWEAA